MEPLLTVEHLSISFTRYGRGLSRVELNPIRDLSLSLEAGQVTAVVGASGSGKSLLAHAILHLLPRNARVSGILRYGGAPLTQARAEALIPQGVTWLDPMMKVGPQLRRGQRNPSVRARCREALDRCGLGPEVEELYPFELSGGMARRVLAASAVAEAPRLIVADEPTPGLDPPAARRVLDRFRELAGQGAGVLLITHDLELAITAASRLVVLNQGRTVEELPAARFQTGEGLAHPYTRALWRAMPRNGFEA